MPQWVARHARCFRCLLFLALLVLVSAVSSWAQEYPFVDVTPAGAPRGCFSMLEDSHGGLWLAGCEAGAESFFYFDGNRFISPLQAPFPKVIVSGMQEDSTGGIWIASSGGLYRFYQGQLEKRLDGTVMAGITKVGADVFLTTVSSPGHDASSDADLIRIAQIQGQWNEQMIMKSIPQGQFRTDGEGRILYGCDGGYCELSRDAIAGWRPGSALAITRRIVQTRTSYASGRAVVWRDRSGCLWMRGVNDAAYQCPGDVRPVDVPDNVASVGEPQIIELADGQIVIPSFGRLAIGRPGKFHVLTMLNGYPSAGNLLALRDGLLISNANGLFFMPQRAEFEFWSERDGLDGNTWSVARLGAKTFAVAGDAVDVLSPDRSRWRPWARLHAGTQLLPGPEGTLLVASHTEGVVQLGADGNVIRRSTPTDVAMLAQTPDGVFWAGGSGIYRIAFRGLHLELENAGSSSMQSAGVGDMKVGADGGLWVCYESGLAHREASVWRAISTRQGLKQNECHSFAIDGNGDVWYSYATVPENALIEKPQIGTPLVQQLLRGELGAPQSHFLNFDHRGWLWRGGVDGLYVADLDQARQSQWRRLNRLDGLPAVDTNQKSFFEDSDGSIWFGADSSIVHLFPSNDFIHPNYAPSVFISAFSLNGGPLRRADSVGDLDTGSDIVAYVGSFQFDRRNALRLRYRLSSEQSDWQLADRLDIHLGKLHWGRHRLEVQAKLGDGPWSSSAVASFVVLKPLWISWPALLGAALVASVAAAFAYRWQKKRRDRARKMLPQLAEWRLAALSAEAGELEGIVLDGRFQIASLVARGGFATIMRGIDLREGKKACAIKIFLRKWADKDWIERRFRQEVLALEQVRHPNVVSILGHGTAPAGAPYLVMEFVVGETLRETLHGGRLTRAEVANYLRQIAAALQAIHARGIFHRDLKPDNLMVRTGGLPGREIVLIDFSIAIVKDAEATLQGLSRAAGTLYYMAPEQAMGYADARSDIHSLAKIVVEMLIGKPLAELLPDAALDLPKRVRELLGGGAFGLSSSAVDRIGAALEFDPARRPYDVSTFAAIVAGDLESAGSEQPLPKTPRAGLSASRGPSPIDGAPGGT